MVLNHVKEYCNKNKYVVSIEVAPISCQRHKPKIARIYKLKKWVLRAFQEYCTYIEPIVNQKWTKTGVPGEKQPDLPMQNLASHMCTERGSNHSDERSNV